MNGLLWNNNITTHGLCQPWDRSPYYTTIHASTSSTAGTSLVLANAVKRNSGPMLGPVVLCDPSVKNTSFLSSVDPKTGATSVVVSNATVDDYSFSKNYHFNREPKREAMWVGGGGGGGGGSLALGEVAMEGFPQLWCGGYWWYCWATNNGRSKTNTYQSV